MFLVYTIAFIEYCQKKRRHSSVCIKIATLFKIHILQSSKSVEINPYILRIKDLTERGNTLRGYL